jgi:hypothetical protein
LFYLLKNSVCVLIRVDRSNFSNRKNKSHQNNGVEKC